MKFVNLSYYVHLLDVYLQNQSGFIMLLFFSQRCDASEQVKTSNQRFYAPALKGSITPELLTCQEQGGFPEPDTRMRIFSGTSNPSLAKVLVVLYFLFFRYYPNKLHKYTICIYVLILTYGFALIRDIFTLTNNWQASFESQ